MKEKENQVITMPTNAPNPQTFLNSFVEPHSNNNRAATLSLIESVDNQNRLFKDQQQNIESQLKKLKRISESLLNENVQLRSLYQERTKDISKLLNSITINTNESITDYQHQQFLMKELNYGILKQIKVLAKEDNEVLERIKADQREIDEINDYKMKEEQQIVNKIKVKLQNQLNKSKVEAAKDKSLEQIQAVNQISNQVTNLIIQKKELQLLISDHRNQYRELYSTVSDDKQSLKNKLKELKIQVAKYQHEIAIDKADEQRISEELLNKKQKYQAERKLLNEYIKKFQKAQRVNQQFAVQEEKIKIKILETNKRIKLTQEKLDEFKYQKSKTFERLKIVRAKVLKYKTITYQS